MGIIFILWKVFTIFAKYINVFENKFPIGIQILSLIIIQSCYDKIN